MSSTTGITVSYLSNQLGTVVNTIETDLRHQISQLDGNSSSADLLKMQASLQQWTMLIELQSTITKELGDALKSIIQKS